MAASSRTSIGLYLVLYGLASASLLVLNKIAITVIPEPSMLLLTQVGSTALIVAIPAILKIGSGKDVRLVPEWPVLRSYALVAVVFLSTIYSNIRMLQYMGVNSFIVLRCSTPIVVSVLDWLLMGRQLPSRRSTLSLVGVLVCGAAYAYLKSQQKADRDTTAEGLLWAAIWFSCFLTDMLFIKHVVDKHPCSGSERTLYQNGLATPLLLAAVWSGVDGESKGWADAMALAADNPRGLLVLGLSCVAGTVLSFTGLSVRSEISSTAFTVVGVVCKMGSTLLNEFVNPESSAKNLAVIFLVIVCSSMYRQAPMRGEGEGKGELAAKNDALLSDKGAAKV